jgi:hypothetical protein
MMASSKEQSGTRMCMDDNAAPRSWSCSKLRGPAGARPAAGLWALADGTQLLHTTPHQASAAHPQPQAVLRLRVCARPGEQ